MKIDIIIAGVGGQGTVLASRIIGTAGIGAGLHVKTSETIGMAQREGSVCSHIRLGRRVISPLVPRGGADILIGLEPGEALRALCFLKPAGIAVVNTDPVVPISVSLGLCGYQPEELLDRIVKRVDNTFLISATRLARQAGTSRCTNAVMLGAVSALDVLPLSDSDLMGAIEQNVPPTTVAVNTNAFHLGRKSIKKAVPGYGDTSVQE